MNKHGSNHAAAKAEGLNIRNLYGALETREYNENYEE